MVGRRLLFLFIADAMIMALKIASCLGLLVVTTHFVHPLGLGLVVGSSLYLIAKRVWNFLDAQLFGGLRATRPTELSVKLGMLHVVLFVFISVIYINALRDHLNVHSLMAAWVLTQPLVLRETYI